MDSYGASRIPGIHACVKSSSSIQLFLIDNPGIAERKYIVHAQQVIEALISATYIQLQLMMNEQCQKVFNLRRICKATIVAGREGLVLDSAAGSAAALPLADCPLLSIFISTLAIRALPHLELPNLALPPAAATGAHGASTSLSPETTLRQQTGHVLMRHQPCINTPHMEPMLAFRKQPELLPTLRHTRSDTQHIHSPRQDQTGTSSPLQHKPPQGAPQ